MSQKNISAFGTKISIVSTVTFPYGFTLSQFADDVDPLVVEDLVVSKHEMLLNGKILGYRTANATIVELAVIPGTNDDANLAIILAANRVKTKILPTPDILVMTIGYSDGSVCVLSDGVMLSGPPTRSVMAAGRERTNKYKFAFGESNVIGQSGIGSVAGIAGVAGSILR